MVKKDALIVVDIQNDFMVGGSLAVPHTDNNFLSRVNDKINYAYDHSYLIIGTQDWHPVRHVSFDSWPVHCVQKTYGADFPDGLSSQYFNTIFRKGYDRGIESYSVVVDSNGNYSGIVDYLRSNNISHINVCGLAFDYCVGYTALHLASNGFDVVIESGLTLGINRESIDSMKSLLMNSGVHIF